MKGYIVKRILMGDVDDPDLYVAQPIYEWQQTEAGKYVMEHSNPVPEWHRSISQTTYSYVYAIKAYLTPEQITFFKLKFE